MAIWDLCFKQVHKYARLRKQCWIILDPLGNIYEMYAHLTVMTTLLNINHFWITQAGLCLKGTFVKESFMFVSWFFFKSQEEKLYWTFQSQAS